MTKTSERAIFLTAALLATTLHLLSAPSVASASDGSEDAVCGRVMVLRDTSEIFRDIADLDPEDSQDQFNAAIRRYQLNSQAVDAALAPVGQWQLKELVAALTRAWQAKNHSDVRLYAIETYQFLANASQKQSCAQPGLVQSQKRGGRK